VSKVNNLDSDSVFIVFEMRSSEDSVVNTGMDCQAKDKDKDLEYESMEQSAA